MNRYPVTLSKELPERGFVRLPQILAVIPVGRSTWWAWTKSGRAPRSFKLSERCTVWRAEDIRDFLEKLHTDSRGAA